MEAYTGRSGEGRSVQSACTPCHPPLGVAPPTHARIETCAIPPGAEDAGFRIQRVTVVAGASPPPVIVLLCKWHRPALQNRAAARHVPFTVKCAMLCATRRKVVQQRLRLSHQSSHRPHRQHIAPCSQPRARPRPARQSAECLGDRRGAHRNMQKTSGRGNCSRIGGYT